MVFACRNEESTWKLCVRRGRVINTVRIKGDLTTVKFRSQAKAKACADELNEKCFEEYDKYYDFNGFMRDNRTEAPDTLRETMVAIIEKYRMTG